jgi:hypothetical protein
MRVENSLPHAIRTGDDAFRHLFGADIWNYRSTHFDFATLFNDAMQSVTQGVYAEIGAHYPFNNFGWASMRTRSMSRSTIRR